MLLSKWIKNYRMIQHTNTHKKKSLCTCFLISCKLFDIIKCWQVYYFTQYLTILYVRYCVDVTQALQRNIPTNYWPVFNIFQRFAKYLSIQRFVFDENLCAACYWKIQLNTIRTDKITSKSQHAFFLDRQKWSAMIF